MEFWYNFVIEVMKIIKKLEEKKDFTSSEQALADYILENKESALKLNLQDLADCTFVSKPTVIRLYRKLGFESYSDFRISFYQQLAESKEEQSIDYNNPFYVHDSPSVIANKIYCLNQQTIKRIIDDISEIELSNISNILNESDRIFIFAIGDSMIQSKSFLNKLIKINKYPILINEYSDILPNTFNITENDCLLAISYSGHVIEDNIKTFEYINSVGAPSIVITSCKDENILKLFKHHIYLPEGENLYDKIGTIVSQTAINYVLSVLYCMLYETEYSTYSNKNKKYDQFASYISNNK